MFTKYGIVERTDAGHVYKHIEPKLDKLFIRVPSRNVFKVFVNDDTILTMHDDEVTVSRPKRPRPSDQELFGGFSEPPAKMTKLAKNDELDEDADIAELNKSIKGRSEILETYWKPIIEKIVADDTFKKLCQVDLMCRSDGRSTLDYQKVLRLYCPSEMDGISMPLPTRKNIELSLINPNPNFPSMVHPYLDLEKNKYKEYVEAFVYYQLVMARMSISAFSCGDATDYLVDMMRYSVLRDWNEVKKFQQVIV